MTREKAIEIIKKCKEKRFKHTIYTVNEYEAAMDMAIKALRREGTFFDEVLEIIDKYDIRRASAFKYAMQNDNYDNGFVAAITFVRADVLNLKGGDNG